MPLGFSLENKLRKIKNKAERVSETFEYLQDLLFELKEKTKETIPLVLDSYGPKDTEEYYDFIVSHLESFDNATLEILGRVEALFLKFNEAIGNMDHVVDVITKEQKEEV